MPPPPSSRASLSRRGPWLALLSVLVIGAMPFLLCPRLERARAESRGHEAITALVTCIGSPRDDATLRGRAITAQLTGADWPARCREPAAGLEVALATLGRLTPPSCGGRCCADDARCSAIVQARAALARLRGALEGERFAGESARALVDATSELFTVPAAQSSDVPPVAEPSRPVAGDALARGGHDVAALVTVADGTWRLLLHARDKHAVLCDVDPDAASARCAPLPAAVPIADSVLLVDGVPEAPLTILAREDDAIAPERWAIYDAASGERKLTIEHDALGATSSSEGATAALIHDGTGYFLVSRRADPLPVEGGTLGPPLLLGPWLVTADATGRGVTVRVRDVTWRGDEPSLGNATTLAKLAWPATAVTMQGCRSGRTTAIVVAAEPPEPEPEVLVAIHDEERWSHETVTVDDPWFGLACDDGEATLTDVAEENATKVAGGHRGSYVITRQRCTPQGCRRERGEVEATRWRPASRYLATSIGESLAFLWRSGLGDVRVVVARPDTLTEAAARSAFEGDDHRGYHFDRHGAELLVRDGHALLLVGHEEAGNVGTHGFMISRDGNLRRLAILHR